MVELADRGNLAQIQGTTDLAPLIRSRLATDISEGLSILHRCRIIHGDIESEKEYIAKLSDFGFSMVREAANTDVYVGRTRL